VSDPTTVARVEALLFASDRPLSIDAIHRALTPDGVARQAVLDALGLLVDEYKRRRGGFVISEVGKGYEFQTRPEHAEQILRLQNRKPARLSQSALETLAVIAYRQPCTRALIDQIRGVDSSSSVRTLLERNLVVHAGRSEEPGKPHLYRTAKDFLRVFGLRSLDELPSVREIDELTQGHLFRADADGGKGET